MLRLLASVIIGAVIDDVIIMKSWEVCLTGAYGRQLTRVFFFPNEWVAGQDVQCSVNFSFCMGVKLGL